MKKVIVLGIIIIVCNACRKNRLDSYYNSYLEGKWKWVYSISYPIHSPTSTTTYNANENRYIEFTKKAKINFYTENNRTDSKVIKSMTTAENVSNGYISYTFNLRHNEEFIATLIFQPNQPGNRDTLQVKDEFPMSQANQGNDTMYYYNVFVKE